MPLCGKGHAHPSVAAVRACYGVGAGGHVAPVAVPAPSAAPSRTDRHVVFTESEPTPRQVATIQRLGGVMPERCTRGQASSIIGQLYAKRDADKKGTSVSTPTPAHVPSVIREPQFLGHYNREFPLPASLIYALVTSRGEQAQARFAVSKSGTEADDLVFIRVSLIKPYKNGKRRAFQGCVKIQTQHSDDLIDRFVIDPNGKYRSESTTLSPEVMAGYLASVIVDPRSAAIRYGRAKEQCCSCGKSLTDERSRWYGIGPECEKRWPDIIIESDEARGVYVPSVVAGRVSN